jgi:Tol biopolymer transport system component
MRPWRSLGVLCAAVALVVSGCGGDERVQPDFVFVSTRDGDYAIFEMNADGSAQHRLTEPEDDVASNPARLFFQVEPAWSPDGLKIAFASRRSGSFDIYAMNQDGEGTRRLTSTKGVDHHPTWSPKGDRIAFARDGDIWVVQADGSGERRISGIGADESEPSWSPDGAWIAYVRRTPGQAATEIALMRPDGSARRKITNRGGESIMPAWSPDSSRIVFASKADEVYALYTVGLDGRDIRTVVPTANDNFEPAWSPDGSTIAYQEDGAIFTVELGGGDVKRLTDQATNDSQPAWKPRPAADGQ